MKLIKLSEEIFVDPEQIVSIEHDQTFRGVGSPSESCMVKDFDGSRLTLKNGRKVFVNGVMPSQILEMLK